MDHCVRGSAFGNESAIVGPPAPTVPGYYPLSNLSPEDSFHQTAKQQPPPCENFFVRNWHDLAEFVSQTWNGLGDRLCHMVKGAFSFPQTLGYSVAGKPLPNSKEYQIEHDPKFQDIYAMGQKAQEIRRSEKPYG